MDNLADAVAAVVPVKYQGTLIVLGLLIKGAGQAYSAIVAGGGLKRILCAVWFNENIPRVIAKDYKAELSTTLVTPTDVTPTKENEKS